MADKEVREIHTHSSGGGDGGAGMAVAMIAVVVLLLVGGFLFWSYSGGPNVAKGPSVTIETPTTGQGGGGKK
jgi:hypothetical protein